MTEKQKNDVLYVCSLIETIARKTKNHRQDVIRHFTKAGIERQLRLAEVNHCLSFEQVSDELIEDLNIPNGDFDTAAECRYTVPSATSIGMLYQGLVLSTMKDEDAAQGGFVVAETPPCVLPQAASVYLCLFGCVCYGAGIFLVE